MSCEPTCYKGNIGRTIVRVSTRQEHLWKSVKEMRIAVDKHIKTPLTKEKILNLNAGDYVYITGVIYSARDAAHKRMYEELISGEKLPFSIKESIIYYMGPSPAREGQIIGSAGPTTASRMDKYTPGLLDMGLSGMIGKGTRASGVIESMIKNKALYFAATGGAGALLSKRIKESKIIAHEDLGTEAIHELYVENFPLIVAIDSKGNNLYEMHTQIS
jgi:fumarate hydratase subunit beta